MGESMRRRIDDMDKIFTSRNAGEACTRARRVPFYECAQRFRYSTSQLEIEMLAVIGPKTTEACLAKTVCLLQDHLEYGGEIAGRRVDDLQHFGRRGLLLQGLARFSDQPRILDCDHRLIGEGAHQLDLPLGERLDPLPHHRKRADELAFTQ